jgi:hypothetical protein
MLTSRSTRGPAARVARWLVPVLVAGLVTSAPVAGVAAPVTAASTATATGGGGSAGTVNVRDAASYPDRQPSPAAVARYAEYLRGHPAQRSAAPATTPARPQAVRQAPAGPNDAPSPIKSFEGINQNQGTGCEVTCRPSATAASSNTNVVELVNSFIQVHTRSGGLVCGGITLNRLLRTNDLLLEPKIQYDMDTKHFSFLVSVFPADPSQPAAMWVAASDTENGCGTYRVFRLFFPSSFQPGIWMADTSLGQDTHALLIAAGRQQTDGFRPHFVFGLPKSTVYAGGQLSFNTFDVAAQVPLAAVVNAGQPMVTSPDSYFVGSVRQVGYVLYRLSNSGGPGATLTLQATISAPFDSPSRGARQPGTDIGLSPTFGEIFSAPYYDGRRVWFTHEVQALGGPTVLYGAIDTVTNGVTFAFVKRSSTSDDVNPSIAVGVTPTGPRVYLNWVFTDVAAGFAASLIMNGLSPGQPILTMFGGNLYTIGSVTHGGPNGVLFGGYSSTSIDPRQTAGACASTAQSYFGPDGNWRTRLALVGSCPLT